VKNAVIGIAAVCGLAAAASAQTFTLGQGQLEYRVVADHTTVTGAADALVHMALQVRYVGGDVRATSLGATHGSIRSNEADSSGTLLRDSVRTAPFGNNDFGVVARTGMTEGHRELFAGGSSNNNADQNGGNASAGGGFNPNNGGGEFRWAPGLAGFQSILAFDNASTGVGRPDGSGDGLLISSASSTTTTALTATTAASSRPPASRPTSPAGTPSSSSSTSSPTSRPAPSASITPRSAPPPTPA